MLTKKCAACTEKDRLILTLAENVDWLRNQLGAPSQRAAINPTGQPVLTDVSYTSDVHMTEEEEDVAAMLKAGRITEEQVPEMLAALGFAGTDIDFAN